MGRECVRRRCPRYRRRCLGDVQRLSPHRRRLTSQMARTARIAAIWNSGIVVVFFALPWP
jgi:hypothetical protein